MRTPLGAIKACTHAYLFLCSLAVIAMYPTNYDQVLKQPLNYLLTEREHSGYDLVEAVDLTGNYWTIAYPHYDEDPINVRPCFLGPQPA